MRNNYVIMERCTIVLLPHLYPQLRGYFQANALGKIACEIRFSLNMKKSFSLAGVLHIVRNGSIFHNRFCKYT